MNIFRLLVLTACALILPSAYGDVCADVKNVYMNYSSGYRDWAGAPSDGLSGSLVSKYSLPNGSKCEIKEARFTCTWRMQDSSSQRAAYAELVGDISKCTITIRKPRRRVAKYDAIVTRSAETTERESTYFDFDEEDITIQVGKSTMRRINNNNYTYQIRFDLDRQ
jgi:hypothetical protein